MRGAIATLSLVLIAAFFGLTFGSSGAVGIIVASAVCLVLLLLAATTRSTSSARETTLRQVELGPAFTTSLRNLFVVALLIRLVLALVLNLTGAATELAPDSWGYTVYGQYIAASWEDPRIDPGVVRGYRPLSFYQHLNAALIYLTGMNPAIPLSLLNGVIGTISAWLVGLIAGRLYGPVAQRRAFLLAAFFPSLILWSSINMRDAWNWLLVAGAVLCGQKLRERFDLRSLVLLLLCVGLLPTIRGYMLVLVVGGLAISFLLVRARSIPIAVVAFGLLVGLLLVLEQRFGLEIGMGLDERLELMNRMKWGLSGGRAGYFRNVDISTPIGAASYLPLGTAIFLFAPFPWSADNLRQIAAVPETLVWYIFFAQAMRQIVKGRASGIFAAAPLVSTLLVIMVGYGLVEGNEGTAYRHRSIVMLLFFVLAAGDYARRVGSRVFGSKPVLIAYPAGAPDASRP